MALATEGVALAAASAASGRRRGQRKTVGWGAVFCFGSRRELGEVALAEGATPWERWSRRRKRRTVPVDGDRVPGMADRDATRRGADDESRKGPGPRLPGCCFLAPARTPGRKNSTMDGSGGRSAHDKQRQPEHAEQQPQQRSRSRSQVPATSRTQATDGSRTRRAEQPRGAPAATRARARPSECDNEEPGKGEASARRPPCSKASSAGVGAFGPVVGLSVVAAVSMAGLLGGRLWAVACVCAWLAALSGLRRRAAGSGTAGSDRGEGAVAHVDSTDYKKLVVLRGLLERDRTKARDGLIP